MFVSFRFHSPSLPSPTLLAAWLTVLTGQKLENGTLIRPSRCVKFKMVNSFKKCQLCNDFFGGDSIGVGWSSRNFLLLDFVPWHHLDLRNCNFPMVPFFKLCQLWNMCMLHGICMLHMCFLPTFLLGCQECEKNSGHLWAVYLDVPGPCRSTQHGDLGTKTSTSWWSSQRWRGVFPCFSGQVFGGVKFFFTSPETNMTMEKICKITPFLHRFFFWIGDTSAFKWLFCHCHVSFREDRV